MIELSYSNSLSSAIDKIKAIVPDVNFQFWGTVKRQQFSAVKIDNTLYVQLYPEAIQHTEAVRAALIAA